MKLRARQHIYANVERDRSPTRTAGFQTLFYTEDGISKADVEAMEERVFYVFASYNPVKRLFFKPAAGKVAFSQLSPTSDRDFAGRSGLYVAHTLVFDEAEFANSGVYPAEIFASFTFATTVDEAFDCLQDDSLPVIEVEVRPLPMPKTDWSLENLSRLVQYAVNHELLAEKNNALALVGEPEAIEHTLHMVHALLPKEVLHHCTFDTFFERGGNLNFTPYWSTGFKQSPRQPIYLAADVDACEITSNDTLGNAASPYGRWVEKVLLSDGIDKIISQKQTAYRISAFLTDQAERAENILKLDAGLLAEVLAANKLFVEDQIRSKISAHVPDRLSERVFGQVISDLTDEHRVQILEQGFEMEELLDYLVAAYKQNKFKSPEKPERAELVDLIDEHPRQSLAHLLLIWGGRLWENPVKRWRIKGAVEDMGDEEYEAFWNLAVPARLVEPLDLLLENKVDVFLKLAGPQDRILSTKLLDIVKFICKADQGAQLDLLIPYLGNIKAHIRSKAASYVAGRAGVSAEFLKALQ